MDNAVVAVRLLEVAAARGIAVTADAIARGLADVRWPARLEELATPRGRVLIDGAHNPAGARALASYLADLHPAGLPMVAGMMADKALEEMVATLARMARPLVLTRAPGARAADPRHLADIARVVAPVVDVLVEPDVELALARAWSRGPLIVVAGSLYLAGDVLARLGPSIE